MPDPENQPDLPFTDLIPRIAALCSSRDPQAASTAAAALLLQLTAARRVLIFLVPKGEGGPRLAAAAPPAPGGSDTVPLDVVRRLIGPDSTDPVLQTAPLAFGMPLRSGGRTLGAVVVEGVPLPPKDSPARADLEAAASILASALLLSDLYQMVGDQAGQLQALQAGHTLEASLSRSVLEAVADGVLVTNGAHQVALINSGAQKILGLDPQVVLGQPAVGVVGVFGPIAPEWVTAVRGWVTAPASQAGESISQQLTLDDGRIVALRVAPIRHEGEFLGTVTVFRDVTREIEVNRLKSEFVATVSHELRTPMTSIRGNTEILLMGAVGALNEEQRHHLQVIRSNAERLGMLVNDLLDVSRIETGRVILAIQPVDVSSAIEQASRFGETLSRERGKPLAVIAEAAPGLPAVRADPARLRQILENLMANSFNFTPAGGRITLRAVRTDGQVEMSVEDTGTGIPPADLPRVFDRFFRGEQSLTLGVPGTGLGLSIVQNLITLHGGTIRIESPIADDRGTRVTFTLPIVPET
jgi:signal transduction histidine kinase